MPIKRMFVVSLAGVFGGAHSGLRRHCIKVILDKEGYVVLSDLWPKMT